MIKKKLFAFYSVFVLTVYNHCLAAHLISVVQYLLSQKEFKRLVIGHSSHRSQDVGHEHLHSHPSILYLE